MAVTTRLLIVCTEAVRVQMNSTLSAIDPTSSGDVMVAALALPSSPDQTAGRWTSWAMTEEHRQAILRAYGQQGWRPLMGTEGQVLASGDTVPPWGSQRFWLFDGAWSSSAVLRSLGLVPLAVVEE